MNPKRKSLLKKWKTIFIAHQDAQKKIQTDQFRNQEQKIEDAAFWNALQDQKKVSLRVEDNVYKKKIQEKMKK
jgi:hypothetical protein